MRDCGRSRAGDGFAVHRGYPVPQRLNRVGLLAPMTHELAPLVDDARARPRSDDPYTLHDATVDGVEFVATMTGIGMAAAADATHRVLDDGAIDHVIVIGIAGGLDPRSGDRRQSSCPVAVLHGDTGTTHASRAAGRRTEPRGTIRSSDDFLTDPAVLAELVASGFVALDMETAAVAVVCEARGVQWSVFRSISDRPADGLVDSEVWEMTQIDGSADEERAHALPRSESRCRGAIGADGGRHGDRDVRRGRGRDPRLRRRTALRVGVPARDEERPSRWVAIGIGVFVVTYALYLGRPVNRTDESWMLWLLDRVAHGDVALPRRLRRQHAVPGMDRRLGWCGSWVRNWWCCAPWWRRASRCKWCWDSSVVRRCGLRWPGCARARPRP